MQSGYPWNQSKARDCRLRLVWKTGHKQNEQQRIHATQIDNHKYIVRVVRCNHKFAESNGWLVRRVAPGELVGIVKSCTCSVVCSYFAAPAMACWTPPIVFDVSTPFSSTVTVSSPFSITLQASSETYVQTRLASLQLLSNSLTFPHISSEYLRSIDPRNSSDTKTKCMLILTAILIYTVTTMTTVFFSRLQWNNSLLLFGCTKAIIFGVNMHSDRPHAASNFHWLFLFSLTPPCPLWNSLTCQCFRGEWPLNEAEADLRLQWTVARHTWGWCRERRALPERHLAGHSGTCSSEHRRHPAPVTGPVDQADWRWAATMSGCQCPDETRNTRHRLPGRGPLDGRTIAEPDNHIVNK